MKKIVPSSIVSILLFFLCTALQGQEPAAPVSIVSLSPEDLSSVFGLTKPEIQARSAVVIDFATGTILYAKNPDVSIPPASLAKLVTIYITCSLLEEGTLRPDEPVNISVNAWAARMPGSSLMFLEPGQRVTVFELLQGLSVVSGNDAAVALAEHISGSVEQFVELMNETMEKMGFRNLSFTDSSGLDNGNVVNAREFALFCREYIRRFPENLENLHSVQELSYPLPQNMPVNRPTSTRTIHQTNRNLLLWEYADVDGLKTGYIDESGYNYAVTAKRDEMRLIVVALGGPGRNHIEGNRIRAQDGIALFSYSFDRFTYFQPQIPELRPVPVWKGAVKQVSPEMAQPDLQIIPKETAGQISVRVTQKSSVTGPLAAGDILGEVAYLDGERPILTVPITVSREVHQAGFLRRFFHSIALFWIRVTGRQEPEHLVY